MLCHRDALNHTCFHTEIFLYIETPYTEMLLHRDAFTHRNVFLHTSTLQTDDFTLSNFSHRYQNKRRCCHEGMDLHLGFLPTGIFTQTYYCMISDGGRAYSAKSSASICKIAVSPPVLMVETHFVGKGWPAHTPTSQFGPNV